ncbi:MAG: TIGR01777 family protein [Armatimonadetes bacterium]|nr:TIGR01777 family protein [Armatimonadota bacterium]
MKIAMSGSTGLIGSALVPYLTEAGHEVIRLVRRKPEPDSGEIEWHPEEKTIDAAGLEGVDAVLHLSGENIDGRWTPQKKARIRGSRVESTKLLSETVARLEKPLRVMISASAVGYYGDRGSEVLREESAPGSTFLADVCKEWEAATKAASAAGIRVVNTRFGVVLSQRGGALEKMLGLFRRSLGGKMGDGRQYVSWVAIDDLLGAVEHALATDTLWGPVNVVSPNPITNEELTRVLARVLSKPAVLTVPPLALKLAFGGLADDVLLASQRVEPASLLAAGYVFRYPELEGALRHLLQADTPVRPAHN